MKSLAEAKKFIKDNDVKYILAQFVDIHGVAKVKSVPAAHLEDIIATERALPEAPSGGWASSQWSGLHGVGELPRSV